MSNEASPGAGTATSPGGNPAGAAPSTIASYIDHTLLKPEASEAEILKVCAEAAEYKFKSVCVNPVWVKTVKKALRGTGVLTCSVVGFPLGATPSDVKAFEARGVVLKPLAVDRAMQAPLEDLTALYRAVSYSIVEHTYQRFPFPTKLENFDYSLGPIDDVLKRSRADALVIVYGIDQISTTGRKALRGVGLVLGSITGQPVVSSGTTALNIALVDRSGAVLWYNIAGQDGGYDLRDPASARAFVQRLVADFPSGAP